MVLAEDTFYPLVAHWLKLQGYDPVITGGQKMLSIPIASLLPGRLSLEPDVIGLKDGSTLAAIEVKTDGEKMREGLGQCLVYTTAADKVWFALPEDLCQEIRSLDFFKFVRLGLLSLRRTVQKVDSVIDETGRMNTTPAQDPGDFRLSTGSWFVQERIEPGPNYNVDFAGLHAELLRQTKLALGKH